MCVDAAGQSVDARLGRPGTWRRGVVLRSGRGTLVMRDLGEAKLPAVGERDEGGGKIGRRARGLGGIRGFGG